MNKLESRTAIYFKYKNINKFLFYCADKNLKTFHNEDKLAVSDISFIKNVLDLMAYQNVCLKSI